MTDHSLVANFSVSADCNDHAAKEQYIIQRMALSVCPAGTAPGSIPPVTLYEASRVYAMVNAMIAAAQNGL